MSPTGVFVKSMAFPQIAIMEDGGIPCPPTETGGR